MLAPLSNVHMQDCRKMVVQICKTVASEALRQKCKLRLLYVLQHSCGSHAIKRKVFTLHGNPAAVLQHSQAKYLSASSYISRMNTLCVLQQPNEAALPAC